MLNPRESLDEGGGWRTGEQGCQIATFDNCIRGVPARRYTLGRLDNGDCAGHAGQMFGDRGHVRPAHGIGVGPEDDPAAAQLGEDRCAWRGGGTCDRGDRGDADAPEGLGALLTLGDDNRRRHPVDPLDAVQREVDDRHATETQRSVRLSPDEALRSVRMLVALVTRDEGPRGVP
jgi:hypothetical protein